MSDHALLANWKWTAFKKLLKKTIETHNDISGFEYNEISFELLEQIIKTVNDMEPPLQLPAQD